MEITAREAIEYLGEEYVDPNVVFEDSKAGVALRVIKNALNLAYEALKKVEWHSQWEDDVHCPFCDANATIHFSQLDHFPSCPRQLALAAIGAEET